MLSSYNVAMQLRKSFVQKCHKLVALFTVWHGDIRRDQAVGNRLVHAEAPPFRPGRMIAKGMAKRFAGQADAIRAVPVAHRLRHCRHSAAIDPLPMAASTAMEMDYRRGTNDGGDLPPLIRHCGEADGGNHDGL